MPTKRIAKRDVRLLRDALLDLTGFVNSPQPDAALIASAGVELDRALFPLLTRIERRGPLGVGELADLVGRDYTTVSRQVAKLESSGLVVRQANARDARIREAVVSAQGKAMTVALDAARGRVVSQLVAEWEQQDVADLARLLRRFADDALRFNGAAKAASRGD